MISLLAKELALLAVMMALGAAPAAWLRVEDEPGARLVLAPAFGLALAAGSLMTLNFVTPLRHAFWFFLLPASIVSVLVALRWLGRPLRAALPKARDALAIGAVAVVALVTLNAPLFALDTPGPVGYGIFDAPAYLSYIDAAQRYTNDRPLVDAPPDWDAPRYDSAAYGAPWDLSARYAWGWKWQHTGAATVPAAMSEPLGAPGWTLLMPLMVVCIVIAALGAFALVRAVTGVASLGPAVLAGCLVPGAALLQIVFDGSVGLSAGSALMPLILVMIALLATRPSLRQAVLAGVAFGGMQAVYPELMAITTGSLLLFVITTVFRSSDRARTARRVAPLIGVAGVVALFVGLRNTPWTLRYAELTRLRAILPLLVRYNVDARYLPGWLLQSREFYSFCLAQPAGPGQTLFGTVLPLLAAPLLLLALRFPRAWLLASVVAIAALQAALTLHVYDCTYCVQRALLATSTVIPALLGCGLAQALAPPRRRVLRIAALVTAALVASAAIMTTKTVVERNVGGAVVTPSWLPRFAARVGALPPGTIQLEGFQTSPFRAWFEAPATYVALRESGEHRLSIVPTFPEWGGLAYWRLRPAGNAAYDPDYRYVVTRLAAIRGRRELFRQGPFSVQVRARPFDVTVARGVATEPPAIDPAGRAWLQLPGTQFSLPQGALTFWIAAAEPATAYVRARLRGPPTLAVTGPEGTVAVRRGDELEVCVPVRGPARRRELVLDVTPSPPGVGPTYDAYGFAPSPAKTIELIGVSARRDAC